MRFMRKCHWMVWLSIWPTFCFALVNVEPTPTVDSAAMTEVSSNENSESFYHNKKWLAQQLEERILSKLDGKAAVGVRVWSLKEGSELLSKNAVNAFIPASNVKIFTAVAALLALGADYHFETQLLASPQSHFDRRRGLLQGDLYLRFSGDPSLKDRDISAMVADLARQGIKQISGHIVIDDYIFNGDAIGPGWSKSDTHYCYGAPVSGVIINHNCELTTRKTSFSQKICHVARAKKHHGRMKIKTCSRRFNKARHYVVEQVVHTPLSFAQTKLLQALETNHIQFSGDISHAPTPTRAIVLARHHSSSLTELLITMLKESDNLYADALFKKIGAVVTHGPGNWQTGAMAVRRLLSNQAHLNIDHIQLVDGSGMSRHNAVTPEEVTELLKFAYHKLPNGADFILALPVGGVDGTLSRRLRNPEMQGRVRAKTGTLKQVTALSGYLQTHHEDVLVFSILINGVAGSGAYYRQISDELLTASAKSF